MPEASRFRAGDLIHRADIYQPTSTGADSDGETSVSFSVLYSNVPCRVDAIAGREERSAERIAEMVAYRVKIYWRDGIKPSMQVRTDGMVLRIESVINPDARKIELQLLCKQVANG